MTPTTEERSLKTVMYVYNGTPYSYGKNVSNYMNQQGCVCAQSCPICCDPVDYSMLGFSVCGWWFFFFKARILEWVAISSSRGSSQPRDQTYLFCISCSAGGFFFTAEPPGKPESTRIHLRNSLLGIPWWSSG